MSLSARSHRKSNRRLCECGRTSRYYSLAKHSWRWRADHPLCTACTRSARDAMYAARRAEGRRPLCPSTAEAA